MPAPSLNRAHAPCPPPRLEQRSTARCLVNRSGVDGWLEVGIGDKGNEVGNKAPAASQIGLIESLSETGSNRGGARNYSKNSRGCPDEIRRSQLQNIRHQ